MLSSKMDEKFNEKLLLIKAERKLVQCLNFPCFDPGDMFYSRQPQRPAVVPGAAY